MLAKTRIQGPSFPAGSSEWRALCLTDEALAKMRPRACSDKILWTNGPITVDRTFLCSCSVGNLERRFETYDRQARYKHGEVFRVTKNNNQFFTTVASTTIAVEPSSIARSTGSVNLSRFAAASVTDHRE
jgi:hypothetical protein